MGMGGVLRRIGPVAARREGRRKAAGRCPMPRRSAAAAAGPLALAAPSERFHWLTAPRSDVLQSSPVHEGIGDPAKALDELFMFYVENA